MAWRGAARVVILASEHYVGPAPPDWPPVTWGGFSVWDGPVGGQLDEAVSAYLDAGEPPVLVTLGTAPATRAGAQFRAIAEGLDSWRVTMELGRVMRVISTHQAPGVDQLTERYAELVS